MNAVTREEWMHALLGLQRGRMCWCDYATGNPMVTEHTPPCRNVRELFLSTAKPITDYTGPGNKGGGEREVVPSSAAPGG